MSVVTLILVLGYLVIFVSFLSTRNKRSPKLPRSLAVQMMRVPDYHQSQTQFSQELIRARRYGRPLSVVVLMLDETASDNGGAGDSRTRRIDLAFLLLGSVWRDATRKSDLVTWDPVLNRYVIALTETGKSEAQRLSNRLLQLSSQGSDIRFRAGFAEFPTDGLTVEDLVNVALAQLEESSQPALPVAASLSQKQPASFAKGT